VVFDVGKNQITGYLSTPKEAGGAPAAFTATPPASPDSLVSLIFSIKARSAFWKHDARGLLLSRHRASIELSTSHPVFREFSHEIRSTFAFFFSGRRSSFFAAGSAFAQAAARAGALPSRTVSIWFGAALRLPRSKGQCVDGALG